MAARTAVPPSSSWLRAISLSEVRKVARFAKKTGVMYLACILLYLPLNALTPAVCPDLSAAAVRGNVLPPLVLSAVMLGLIIAQALSRTWAGLGIAAAPYLAGLLGDSYWGLMKDLPGISIALRLLYLALWATRAAGLSFAPIFLMLGAAMPKRPGAPAPLQLPPGWSHLLGPHALRGPAPAPRRLAKARQHVRFSASCHVLSVHAAARAGQDCSGLVCGLSMLVYALHPWVIVLVRGAARPLGLWGADGGKQPGHYLAVCAGTAAASAVLLDSLAARSVPRSLYDKARAWVEVDAAASQAERRAAADLPSGCELMPVLKCRHTVTVW